eukprot:268331-Rhodomonas_salina.1
MWFLVFDLALDLSWARTRRVPVPRTWISASAVAESARTGQCMCVSAYMSVLMPQPKHQDFNSLGTVWIEKLASCHGFWGGGGVK